MRVITEKGGVDYAGKLNKVTFLCVGDNGRGAKKLIKEGLKGWKEKEGWKTASRGDLYDNFR